MRGVLCPAARRDRRRRRGVATVGVALAVALSACGAPDTLTPDLPAATSTPTATATAAPPSTSTPEPTPEPTSAGPSATTDTATPSPTPGPTPTATADDPTSQGVPEAWRGVDVETFDTSRRVVALTFDGGASNIAVASVLGTLDRLDVPATFFVTGAFARTYPASVRAIAAAGHAVGNHSDTHPSFPDSTDEEIRTELARADASISALTGERTAPLFRFPFGDRTPLDIQVVNDAGYIPFRWTVDTLGWQGTDEGITVATVRDRVLDTLQPGQIVLMHVGAHPDDGSTLDADALPGMVGDLRERGYDFVTIPEMLG
ncbi:polysaccharide deacetylase family protein [Ornithinimicrobium sediminis]|uniref:polysaccharide deacetylase family protein n=1 Tax=Ornithinimicrobium sediminis TaxID=2904603 RepID=UPI001E30F991|nr:polysaccharide deacetylase family protein [Ornithinimicrobium sediminis]MCE0486789.1 polysaccharide deacetylase family protein [Ornithinimicrobium sediminis]